MAQARVEELRQIKEAQYWGREVPAKRDLPPYWSVSAFGQPFNDQRLFTGANNFYQVLGVGVALVCCLWCAQQNIWVVVMRVMARRGGEGKGDAMGDALGHARQHDMQDSMHAMLAVFARY